MSILFKYVILIYGDNMVYDGMMMSRVTSQLNKEILKGRINKIYCISKNEILMTIRSQGTNKKLLVSIHPMYARLQLTSLSYPTPDFPSSLTMLLRKHLEGGYIFKTSACSRFSLLSCTSLKFLSKCCENSIILKFGSRNRKSIQIGT